MNRRTQLKLESAKIFTKKYILSGRFVVRNTLAVMAVATIAGGTVVAANIAGDSAVNNKGITTAVIESVEEDNEDRYVITLNDSAVIETASVDMLYGRLDEEGVLTASNETNNLTKSENDMTGRFIVSTDGLNLRAEASEDGNIIAVLNTGDTGVVVGMDGDWTMVASAESEGYVKTEYILTDDEATAIAEKASKEGISYREAIGVEEQVIVAEVATEAPVQPTTEQAQTTATTQQTTEQSTAAVQPTTEATTQATTEATTQAMTETTTQAATQTASSDLYLLAAIVYAEAGGESYEGQLAVANVVLNRVYSGAWGGSSISAVVYAPSQFTAIYSSAFTNALSTGGSATSLQAAQDALNGSNNIGGYTSFRPAWNVNTSSLGSYTQIGNHIFF